MKHLTITAIMAVMCIMPASAQWTLKQCVEHAIQHNISLKQQRNVCRQRELDLSTARNARLPDLNASVSENLSFGRGLTSDNTYTNNTTNSTSLALSTSIPILTGMRIPHQTKLAHLNLEAATADLEKASNDISLKVAQYFMQAVYSRELAGVAQRQVETDSIQTERLKRMLEQGKASVTNVSQQQAALAQSRLTLTQARNDMRVALLELAQLLELQYTDSFSIVPDNNTADATDIILSTDDIYRQAVTSRPEIAAGLSRVKGADESVSIAKAALYPQLALTGGLNTNYYKTSGLAADNFGKQMKNNFSPGIALSLSIPIFNRMQTRNSIRSAEYDRQNAELSLENTRKTLYKEIQQVCLNTTAAQEKYRSSTAALTSAHDAFGLMKAKYENGKANITEFNEAKTQLMKAESEQLQARYELQYQMRLVGFYTGKPIWQ